MIKAWRTFTIPSVIHGLKKIISHNASHHALNKRNDILISLDAVLNRSSILLFNENETIVKSGGIETMIKLLKIFSTDTEIVHVVFEIFVTLMCKDEEKMKRKRIQKQKCKQSTCAHHMKQPDNSSNVNNCSYPTARRIHLVGYAKDLIVHLLDHYQDKHDDIRILGKSIVKDLIRTESYVAMEILSQINEAITSNVSFETYATMNRDIIIPSTKTKDHIDHGSFDNDNDNDIESDYNMNCTRKNQQDVPGKMAIDILLSHMLTFIEDDNIQLMGLTIILKCLHLQTRYLSDSSTNDQVEGSTVRAGAAYSMLVNDRCAIILLKLLQSKRKYEIQWRSHVVLMKLTYHHEICNYFERNGGCDYIMSILSDLAYKDEYKPIYQMNLWVLTNICRVDNCLHTLIQLGLKALLYTLIKQDNKEEASNVVLPLSLRTLFSELALKEGSYLEEGPKTIKPQKVTNATLPLPLNVHPSHGTTDELFHHGRPGLI